MFIESSKSSLLRSKRKRPARHSGARKHYLEFLEQRQLLTTVSPVQTFFLPYPASSVLQTLQTIHSGPGSPVSSYTSIAVAADNTKIFYDQWENGYVSDLANPTAAETYNSVTNPAGVQIWGDGNLANGAAPGIANDTLHAGDFIILASPSITVPRNPSEIYFDGGDKIAVTKSVAVGVLDFASGSATLLSGALVVDPTSSWGTSYKIPVGQNTPGAQSMFDYTGMSIMAAKDGTTIMIDIDGNGTTDIVQTLNQGQSYLVNNGVKQGATVVSTDANKPVQVDVVTGTPTQMYASRWFTLAPVSGWSSSYYTPVSTRSTNATEVFLYNPSSAAITVIQETRGAGGTAATITATAITVAANGTAIATIAEGSGAHFSTANNQVFYALSTTDVGSFNYDWGMTLIAQNQLTTQAIVGMGFGRDPLSSVNPTENGSPVWVTPVGNGNTPVTVYVDYNGDNLGALTDPNGYHYDVALSLKELQLAKVFDPDGNQGRMLLYTLDPAVKLAVAWGEDPSTASSASPGIDAGTNVVPLPEFDGSKSATLNLDANGDGVVSPGDTLQYTIVVNNISRTAQVLSLKDVLPSELSYVPGTLAYTITPRNGVPSSPIFIPDAGTTPFALDENGLGLPLLAAGATFTATFKAKIADVLPLGQTDVINTGVITSTGLKISVQIQADTPVKYDVRGLVFEDINRNGAQGAGEPGLAGVRVNLMSGSSVVATALTDATGHYVIVAPALGSYTVDVVDSSRLAVLPNSEQTAGTDPSTVNVTGGGAFTDAGIDGYMTKTSAIPSRLMGRVTVDGTGLAGVALTLTGTNAQGAIAPITVTSAADGTYSFEGVMAGTYTISEAQPSGLLDGADFAGSLGGTALAIPGDQISAITVPGDAVGTDYNFTEVTAASITGSVYADSNNNGLKDAGEVGISGVMLTLTGTNDLGTITPITVTTGAAGTYSFGALRPGTYTVTETQPSGYLDGLDARGTAVIANSSTTDVISGITVAAGGLSVGNKFGELLPSNASGFVYYDANNNGIKDSGAAPILFALVSSASAPAGSGEVGIGGVQLTLTGTNDLGAITPITVITADDGTYNFGALRPGTYTVTETQPSGYFDGLDANGGIVVAGSNTTDVIAGITLAVGASSPAVNFGELLPAVASGCVYEDSNNNGIKDASEPGVSGVMLTLTGTDDLGVITPITLTTGAGGAYSFGALRPGTYTITETQPDGYIDGLDAKGAAVIANSNTTDVIAGLSLASGDSAVGNKFGELLPGSTSGTVFADANNNGIQDGGEIGITGVLLTLTGTNDLGPIAPVTVTTGADGTYSIGNLRPGTYTITETQPAGYLDGLDSKAGAIIAGSGTTDVIGGLTLGSGGSAVDNKFAEILPGSASGSVYADANNNGIKDAGETGIGGVVLTLTGTNDLGAITPIIVTTTSDGMYSFGALRPGTYAITETQAAGYFDGLDAKGAAVIANSNTTDVISDISIATGGSAVGNKFGELLASNVSGTIYVDANNNGIQDGGEAGIASAVVTLTGSNDFGVISPIVVTTGVDGSYNFGALRPGTYTITETQPAGYLDGKDTVGSLSGTAGNDVFSSIAVASGATGIHYNFGELVAGSASGFVYNDVNNNGIKDSGEAGIGGVQVTLTGSNDLGVITAITVTTAADGSYNFGALRPGTYTITEAQPSGYFDGLDAKGGVVLANSATTDVIGSVALSSAGSAANNNFGELRAGSVSGFVYNDVNKNGTRESGEAGIGGVRLTLTGSNDLGTMAPIVVNTAADGSYTFSGLRPGTYTITETQPAGYTDGLDAKGGVVITGSNATDVIGGIAVGSGGSLANNNFGETVTPTCPPPTCPPPCPKPPTCPPPTCPPPCPKPPTCPPPCAPATFRHGDTATIGYWQNKNGQALIKSLNGSANSTKLGNWLAATFPNLYGANAGSMNLAGKTNTYIAALYVKIFSSAGSPKLDAQVFAVALATYATSTTLAGGNYAGQYGFNVTATGIGSHTFNVGGYGAAVGVPNNTSMTILDMLKYVNTKSVAGVVYNGNTTLRGLANPLFTAINESGDIK